MKNLSLKKKALPKKQGFPQLKEWCIGHLRAPSCYHGSVGQGWGVVEKYISWQNGYENTDTVPVIDEEKEKLRAHKTWYTSLQKTFWWDASKIKNRSAEINA